VYREKVEVKRKIEVKIKVRLRHQKLTYINNRPTTILRRNLAIRIHPTIITSKRKASKITIKKNRLSVICSEKVAKIILSQKDETCPVSKVHWNK